MTMRDAMLEDSVFMAPYDQAADLAMTADRILFFDQSVALKVEGVWYCISTGQKFINPMVSWEPEAFEFSQIMNGEAEWPDDDDVPDGPVILTP